MDATQSNGSSHDTFVAGQSIQVNPVRLLQEELGRKYFSEVDPIKKLDAWIKMQGIIFAGEEGYVWAEKYLAKRDELIMDYKDKWILWSGEVLHVASKKPDLQVPASFKEIRTKTMVRLPMRLQVGHEIPEKDGIIS